MKLRRMDNCVTDFASQHVTECLLLAILMSSQPGAVSLGLKYRMACLIAHAHNRSLALDPKSAGNAVSGWDWNYLNLVERAANWLPVLLHELAKPDSNVRRLFLIDCVHGLGSPPGAQGPKADIIAATLAVRQRVDGP